MNNDNQRKNKRKFLLWFWFLLFCLTLILGILAFCTWWKTDSPKPAEHLNQASDEKVNSPDKNKDKDKDKDKEKDKDKSSQKDGQAADADKDKIKAEDNKVKPSNNKNVKGEAGKVENKKPESGGNSQVKPLPVPRPGENPKPEITPRPEPTPKPEPSPEPSPQPEPGPKPEPQPIEVTKIVEDLGEATYFTNVFSDEVIFKIVKLESENNQIFLQLQPTVGKEDKQIFDLFFQSKKTTQKLQPKSNSSIKIKLKTLPNRKVIGVYHENETQSLKFKHDTDKNEVLFTATNFSNYVVVYETQNIPQPPADNRVEEAKEAIKLALAAKEEYAKKIKELNNDHLISPAEKQTLDQLKEKYEAARTKALEKYENARGAADFATINKDGLIDVPEIIVNDIDDNKKADNDEIDEAENKITLANQAYQKYQSELQKNVTNDQGTTSPDDLAKLTDLKNNFVTLKNEANKLYNDLAEANRTDLTEKYQELNALSEIVLPQVNDADNNHKVDSVEAEEVNRAIENASQAKTTYDNLYKSLVTDDANSVSQADLNELETKKTAYEEAKQAASLALNALATSNPEKNTLTEKLNALSEIVLPQVNDADNNHKVDSVEAEEVNRAIENASQAKTTYDNLYKSLVTDDANSVSQADLSELEAKKTAYEEAKQAASLALNALATSNSEKNTLTEKLNALSEIVLPPVNDADNNHKVDSVEANQAEAEKTKQAKADLSEAERLLAEYRDLLNTLVTNDANSVSQADLNELETKKTAYEAAKQAASDKVNALANTNDEKNALTERLKALPVIDLPTVNDLDNNHKVDTVEISEAEAALDKAVLAKEAYDNEYKTLVTDDAAGTSEEDLSKLTELKNAYDQLKTPAKQLYDALAAQNKTSLTEKYNKLVDLTLPEVTPEKPNKDRLTELYERVKNVKSEDKYIYDRQEDQISFDQALDKAKNVLAKDSATASEIEEAYNDLNEAYNNLDGVFEKKIEFRNVTSAKLFSVNSDGDLTRVTGLANIPDNLSDYLVVLENRGNEIYLPIDSITEENDKYKVVLTYPLLHTFLNNQYVENFSFTVEKIKQGPNIFTDFTSLIDAMKADSKGNYLIGTDILANPTDSDFYVKTFSGTLKSVDGKKYSILNQNKPLFETLIGRVENINFKNVNVTSKIHTGVVAIELKTPAVVKNIYVDGKVTYAPNNVQTYFIGGITGTAFMGTAIENSWVNVNLTAKDQANGQTVGLLAGRGAQATIRNNFVEGNINLTGIEGSIKSKVGRIIGQAVFNSSINNTIVNVTNNAAINGAINDIGSISASSIENTFKIVEQNPGANQLTREQAMQKMKDWKYFFGPSSDNSSFSTGDVDYTGLPEYEEAREKAYSNTEKLLPFYDRHTIIKYGNRIPTTSNLYTKEIKHLSLMKDGLFTTNVYDSNQINKLFILYTDNKFDILPLNANGIYKNTTIMEYSLPDNLIFTPNQFIKEPTDLLTNLKNTYNSVDLQGEGMRNLVRLDSFNTAKKSSYTMKNLYLDDSFSEIKNGLENNLKSLLAGDFIGDFTQPVIKKHIERKFTQNKEKILLALSYINRLYNVNFGDYNIKSLMMYEQNFYNSTVNQLRQLIKIAESGFEDLFLNENYKIFQNKMVNLGKGNLAEFLNFNREMFVPNRSENEWFKESTPAFIYEQSSTNHPELDVALYPRLKSERLARDYILPLLNLKEDNVYVISAPATIFFGGYGRSIDQTLRANEAEYRVKVEEVHNKLKQKVQDWTKFIDFLYNISNESQKQFLSSHLTQVFDGYYIWDTDQGVVSERHENQKRRWASEFDNQYTAINDFFGPIGRYYQPLKNKPDAYVRRDTRIMHFDFADILSYQGSSVLSHELVHSYDEPIILGNNPYRQGQDTESYAMGLFESITSGRSPYYGFNFMYQITDGGPFNQNIDRFMVDTKNSIKQYINGVFDVSYLLNGIEAEIVTAKQKSDQKFFYNKMSLDKSEGAQTVKGINYIHGDDVISEISEAEWSNLNLDSIDALIDNNIVNKTSFIMPGTYKRDNNNNYFYVPLYQPIYAAYQNNEGTVGGLNFKLYALELMAEYGWDDGFVAYASNKYQAEAHQAGRPLSDSFIFGKIFGNTYTDYKQFKKAMYARRMQKKNNFKEITVNYNGENHVVNSYDKLKELMQNAVDTDLAKLKAGRRDIFAREELKKAIFAAFNAKTDNFRTSIFND